MNLVSREAETQTSHIRHEEGYIPAIHRGEACRSLDMTRLSILRKPIPITL